MAAAASPIAASSPSPPSATVGEFFHQRMFTSEDVVVVVLFAFSLHFVRVLTQKYILSRIAQALGITRQRGIAKFSENLWYTVYYTFSVGLAWYIFGHLKWFFLKYDHYFSDYPDYNEVQSYPPLRWYYLFQLAFYLQASVAMMLFDTKRKDFWQMIIHHIVTIALVLFSYILAQVRIGSTVLVIHDIVDIFLSCSKMFNYIDIYGTPKRSWPEPAKNSMFGMFTLVWVLTRNTAFPIWVIWPAWLRFRNEAFYFYRPTLHTFSVDHTAMCAGPYCVNPHQLLIGFLGVLEILHIIWLYAILRMIGRAMSSGLNKDVRSDDDHDDDDLVQEKLTKLKKGASSKQE